MSFVQEHINPGMWMGFENFSREKLSRHEKWRKQQGMDNGGFPAALVLPSAPFNKKQTAPEKVKGHLLVVYCCPGQVEGE